MAEKEKKNPDNSIGSFYVDDQCIACDACVVEAPKFFKMNEDEARAFVFIQPKTEEEIKNALEAKEACPVSAIGSDGL
jgi:ferredoxin